MDGPWASHVDDALPAGAGGTFFPLLSCGGQAKLPAETGADASPYEVHSSDEAGKVLSFPR